MILKTVITGMLVITWFIQAHTQDTVMYLSLKQSCQLGIERNVNVKNAGLEQQKARYQLKEAESNLYPHMEAYSDFSHYFAIPKLIVPGEIFGQTGLIPIEIGTKFDWSSGFKATQVLYNQSYFTSLKLAARMEHINELTVQQKKEEIVYQVSQIYFLCQNTRQQIAHLGKTLANTQRLLEIAALQKENDIIRKADYSRILVNQNNLKTQIDNLKQLNEQQLGLLKYLTGIDLDQKIMLSDSLMAGELKISGEHPDFEKRTELLLLDEQSELISLHRKMNRQSYLPTLAGFGQYYYQGQRNEFDFFRGGSDKFYNVGVVGLSLSIPIFNGFEKQAKEQQLAIEQMQLKNIMENTSVYFSKEFRDAVNQYETSLNSLHRQQENIEIAEETYNISLQGYRQQVVSLSDLLMSESSLTEARLSYFNALMQLNNAELEVKKAKGELLDDYMTN